jgi:hypothetical protein
MVEVLTNEEKIILKKMEELNLEPDLSLIKTSIVSNIEQNQDRMFEEFLKLVLDFDNDKNVFKHGMIPKDGRKVYPLALLGTISEKSEIVQEAKVFGVKPRYTFAAHFFKNYNIGLSATITKSGNRSHQVENIMSSFIRFKAILMEKEAGFEEPDEGGVPSEKLKKGILGR